MLPVHMEVFISQGGPQSWRLDLMSAADQFLLVELKQLCQQLQAEKIDAEVSTW